MALREQAKRGGEPIIAPLRDKKTGQILTNVQIIRNMDKVLTTLKNSPEQDDQVAYSKMINNDEDIYNYIHEIASIENDLVAQNRLNETLLPDPAMAGKLAQMERAAEAKIQKSKKHK